MISPVCILILLFIALIAFFCHMMERDEEMIEKIILMEKHFWEENVLGGIEPVPDSFKRACVSVGIGRELYSAPFIWIPAIKVNIQKKNDRCVTYL